MDWLVEPTPGFGAGCHTSTSANFGLCSTKVRLLRPIWVGFDQGLAGFDGCAALRVIRNFRILADLPHAVGSG